MGNMEKTQFPDAYFDFVLCEGDAFGLTPNPRNAVHEFSRVLKPSGKLSLTITNYYKMLFYNREAIRARGLSEYLQQATEVREPLNGPVVRTVKPETVYDLLEEAS